MTLDVQLRKQLNQTINVAVLVSRSSSGTPTFAAPASSQARVEESHRRINAVNGKEETTTHIIITETPITLHDRVWLPGVDSAKDFLARPVKQVFEAIGEDGTTDHFEVLI